MRYEASFTFDYFFTLSLEYVPLFTLSWESTSLEQQAITLCGGNTVCLFEVQATNSITIATQTITTTTLIQEVNTQLGKYLICL